MSYTISDVKCLNSVDYIMFKCVIYLIYIYIYALILVCDNR